LLAKNPLKTAVASAGSVLAGAMARAGRFRKVRGDEGGGRGEGFSGPVGGFDSPKIFGCSAEGVFKVQIVVGVKGQGIYAPDV